MSFKAEEWANLGVAERVARCHIMAEEALSIAEISSGSEKAAYQALARAWMKVADANAMENERS